MKFSEHTGCTLITPARARSTASFVSIVPVVYYSKIICAHVHEEVGGGVEKINVASVLVGTDAEN
jgi:hypothetical protein